MEKKKELCSGGNVSVSLYPSSAKTPDIEAS
jgi:hypothetical protein